MGKRFMKVARQDRVGIFAVGAAPVVWMLLVLLSGLADALALRGDDTNQPTYFLVELRQPWYDSSGLLVPRQSCVLPLVTPEHIAHARQLIEADAIHNWGTSLAKIAHIHIQAGTDGVNRDLQFRDSRPGPGMQLIALGSPTLFWVSICR
jgi:hypothetical protein